MLSIFSLLTCHSYYLNIIVHYNSILLKILGVCSIENKFQLNLIFFNFLWYEKIWVQFFAYQKLNVRRRKFKRKFPRMENTKMSEGVTIEELSGPIYDKFFSEQKSFKSGFVRFQPYNQVQFCIILMQFLNNINYWWIKREFIVKIIGAVHFLIVDGVDSRQISPC